jgi:hypothetical protein
LLAGRKTLHGHWLCWVPLLQKLRDMLFHVNNTLKEEARGEFVRYADKIMSSSFGDFDLELTHSCGVKEGQMKSDVSSPTLMGDEVWTDPKMRTILLRYSVDFHDWQHRPTCLKRGCECRFNLPEMSWPGTSLEIEAELDDESNVTTWYRLNTDPMKSTPYVLQTKRPMGCQYMNTHSIPVSAVFGCNTNVQLGGPVHLFYSTVYAGKSTQKEDSDKHIVIGTQVCRRLWRMRSNAQVNAMQSPQQPGQQIRSVIESTVNNRVENWTEGLALILSGMCASMTKAVCSSPLGHLMVSKDGSRFEYSHDHTNLLVSQVMDALDGKEIACRIRKNRSKVTKKKVLWPDSFTDDYVHRPLALEELCLYEYTAHYEKECKTKETD